MEIFQLFYLVAMNNEPGVVFGNFAPTETRGQIIKEEPYGFTGNRPYE